MRQIGIRDLRQNASEWLRRVEKGESFEVTARGRPVAWLVPAQPDDVLARLESQGVLKRGEGDLLSLLPLPADPLDSRSSPTSSEKCVQTSGSILYLDSSAIVKLIAVERETDALRTFLRPYPHRVTSVVALVEVMRAARRFGPHAARQAELVLRALSSIDLSHHVTHVAGSLEPQALRSLNSIHLATALLLGPSLEALVTYDDRMASAADVAGIPIASPA